MNILIALLTAYVLYLIQDRVYNRIWNRHLDVDVRFLDNNCTEGDQSVIREVISNSKFLPLPLLRVRFEVQQGLDFGGDVNISVSDKNYRADIYTVMPYRRITRDIPFVCKKRGVYEVGGVSMISNDLLFSRSLVENKTVSSRLTVYPREVDASRIDVPFNRMMGTVLSKRFAYEDPFEFRGIRDYESYDPLSDVNWNASARTGKLMVNTHNYTVSPQVCILLDFDSDTAWKNYALFEEQIRIAATMARLFISQGVPVSIVSNGRDIATGEELNLSSGCGESHLGMVKEGLARIDLTLEMSSFVKRMERLNREDNCQYLLISSSKSAQLQSVFSDISSVCDGCQWILAYPSTDNPPCLESYSGAICWEVAQ